MPSSAFRLPPRAPLFPYTTLFRSRAGTPSPAVSATPAPTPSPTPSPDPTSKEDSKSNSSSSSRSSAPQASTEPNVEPSAAPVTKTRDRKSTRLNSSHRCISYAVFCVPATTARSPLSLHDALPISRGHAVAGGLGDPCSDPEPDAEPGSDEQGGLEVE